MTGKCECECECECESLGWTSNNAIPASKEQGLLIKVCQTRNMETHKNVHP